MKYRFYNHVDKDYNCIATEDFLNELCVAHFKAEYNAENKELKLTTGDIEGITGITVCDIDEIKFFKDTIVINNEDGIIIMKAVC